MYPKNSPGIYFQLIVHHFSALYCLKEERDVTFWNVRISTLNIWSCLSFPTFCVFEFRGPALCGAFWIPPSSSQILQCLLNSGEITGVEHLWIFGADCSQLPSLFVTVFTNSISIHYFLSLVVVVCILWIFIFARSWLQLYSSIRKEFVWFFFFVPCQHLHGDF